MDISEPIIGTHVSTDITGQTNSKNQLKLFLIGSRRTGTVTITSFLENVGYGKKYHGWTLWYYRNRDLKFWEDVKQQNGEDVEWDELFEENNYEITSDQPSILFWKSLVKYYPQMKVVLTMRNDNKWFESYENSIAKIYLNPTISFVITISKYLVPGAVKYFKLFDHGFFQTFKYENDGSRVFDKEYAINQYNSRNEEIIRYFQDKQEKDRFFIMDWDREDKNELFLEVMQFLEIKFTPSQL
eukprot:UN06305